MGHHSRTGEQAERRSGASAQHSDVLTDQSAEQERSHHHADDFKSDHLQPSCAPPPSGGGIGGRLVPIFPIDADRLAGQLLTKRKHGGPVAGCG
jgi:hypothetical protein